MAHASHNRSVGEGTHSPPPTVSSNLALRNLSDISQIKLRSQTGHLRKKLNRQSGQLDSDMGATGAEH